MQTRHQNQSDAQRNGQNRICFRLQNAEGDVADQKCVGPHRQVCVIFSRPVRSDC